MSENTLAAFVEGRLQEGARRGVEEHIADCANCRSVLTGVAGLAQLSVTSSDAPDDLDGRAQELAFGTPVGRYVIETLIGHGAMGTVYAAHDPDLDRRVAVKLLRAESLSDTARHRMRARLLREAKAMARLSHPDVITVYDVGAFGDQLFVAMEHVDGCTLRQWRAEKHRSYAEIMTVYERAGSGLAAAHEAGLVHRDFKPDNVLIGRDGRVRVMDFGLARSDDGETSSRAPACDKTEVRREATSLTHTGALLGTPAYMAPEQLRGHAATTRSDVFSFCVSLYEALYGERPFAGSTIVELRDAIESGGFRPAPMMTRVPGWVRGHLLRGLQASADARFVSMRALLDAFRLAHTRARRLLRRGVAAGFGALSVLLAGAAIYARASLPGAQRDRHPPPASWTTSRPVPALSASEHDRAREPAMAALPEGTAMAGGGDPGSRETTTRQSTTAPGHPPAQTPKLGLQRALEVTATQRAGKADRAHSTQGPSPTVPARAERSLASSPLSSASTDGPPAVPAASSRPTVGNNGAFILE